MAETFDLSVILKFINDTAPGLNSFTKSMRSVGKSMQKIGKDVTQKVTLPIVALGVNAVRMGADFQGIMNMVGAVTGSTGVEFEKLKTIARDLGSETQFSARQAGEAMKFMGMAGFNAAKIMGAVPKVLELAAAAQLDMGSAADITTNIMSGFNFKAKDMARVNDILVNTFTNANVSLPQMGEALKKVGPIASKLKFRFTEVAAALGIMGNNGIQGSEAGVALRRAFINLQKPSKQMSEAMKFMELNFKNADGTMKDLTGIVAEYENAVKKGASETQVMTSMMQIFGPRAVAPMLALLSEGSKGLAAMEEKTKKVGTASEIAKRQMEGLPGALKLVTSAWESVNIALTEGDFGKWVEETTRGFAKVLTGLTDFIKENPETVQWGLKIAALFAITGPIMVGLGILITALGVILSPIGLVVVAITAIGTAITALVLNWDELTEAAGKFFDLLSTPTKLFELSPEGQKAADAIKARKEERERIARESTIRAGLTPEQLRARDEQQAGAAALKRGVAEEQSSINDFSTITVKLEAAPGTSASVTGIEGNKKVNVENEGFVGGTLAGVDI